MIIMGCEKCGGHVEMHDWMAQDHCCDDCCPGGPPERVSLETLMEDPEYAALAATLDKQMKASRMGAGQRARWHQDRHSVIEMTMRLKDSK